jgi:hypothetical protein
MSPHLTQSAAKTQMDDRLRSAQRRRLAAHVRASHPASVPQPSGRRLGLRSLRGVLG